MSERYVDVGSVEDFPAGKVRVVTVDEREVGVVAWEGNWFALRNICPHLGAPLCSGPLRPLLTQESVASRDLTVERDRPVLMCPWHHWEFDLQTGMSVTGHERVKTYPVFVQDGRVKLELAASQRDASAEAVSPEAS